MAEASCSGTTPYKRLIDHQSRDVSHHQDRLVGRPLSGPQGGFRSAPQPTHAQQQQFTAFLDGGSALQTLPHDAAGRLAAHAAALDHAHQSHYNAAAAPSPHAVSQLQSPSPAPLDNWAADFSRFAQQAGSSNQLQNGHAPAQMNQLPNQSMFANAFQQPSAGFTPFQGQMNNAFMGPGAFQAQAPLNAGFDEEMSRWMAANQHGDNMKEVDAAMDQMARELEMNESIIAEAEASATTDISTATQEQNAHFTDLETPEIGNLSLDQRQDPEQDDAAADAQETQERSAVAEAAEQLLETVQHEQGPKWQRSAFLNLMRDFRDGRKDIVDGEIQERPEREVDSARIVADFRKFHSYASTPDSTESAFAPPPPQPPS